MDAVTALVELGGIATLAELLVLTTERRLRTAVAREHVVRCGRGRYALASLHADRLVAARAGGVLSHESAAAVHGWKVRMPSRLDGRLAALYARLVGCDPARAAGDVLAPGGTVPGFACLEAEPGRRLALEGRHRLSRFRLVFRLESAGGGTRLVAETWAEFPGALGAAYRLVVVRSGAHVLVTRRLVGGVARAAERGR